MTVVERMARVIKVSLLGPPRVERDGELVAFDTRKAMALLAHLALTDRPRPVMRWLTCCGRAATRSARAAPCAVPCPRSVVPSVPSSSKPPVTTYA